MAPAEGLRERNRTLPTTFPWVCLFLLLLCDVKTLVSGCRNTEMCLTVSECRRIQKERKIPINRMTGFSIVFPCDGTLEVMTVCCNVGTSQPDNSGASGTVEVHPGYNITYEDLAEGASSSLPVPLPLKQLPPSSGGYDAAPTETGGPSPCGLFRRGDVDGDAMKEQFPWLALLGKKDQANGEFLVDCGASLINDRYVLTSAYCLDNLKAPPEIVRLGDYDRSVDESESTGFPLHYGIEKIIVHEKFNYPFLKNDIALVRLDNSIPEFSDCLRPICLPEAPSPDAAEYIMAGWRTHGSRGVPSTSIPKFGPLSLSNSGHCDLPILVQPLAPTQMCFGSNPSSCFGDFGGPLIEIIKTGAEEKAVQAGIFSYGGSQCNAKFSGELYTKVFPFREWITKNMDA